MNGQTATFLSIAVAIALVIVSLAYGMNLGRLSPQKREATGPDRRPSAFGLLIFFCAAMPGGIVFLWNRPLFAPVLQIVLLCIVPALIGHGLRILLRRRRES